MVHGVAPDARDPIAELDRQYAEAESFLASLSDSFVDGDRERVIIVPGNHDVSYYHALVSMKQVTVNAGSVKGRATAASHGADSASPVR